LLKDLFEVFLSLFTASMLLAYVETLQNCQTSGFDGRP